MDDCFVCGKSVLEFPGEFAFFPGYGLNDAREAIEANACGYAHAACLARTPWGEFWRKKWEWHRGLGGTYSLLGRDSGYTLYRDHNNGNHELLLPEGIIITISRNQFGPKKNKKEGYLFPIAQTIQKKWPVHVTPGSMSGHLQNLASFTALDLAGLWDLRDTFLHPGLVALAEFQSRRYLKRYLQGKLHTILITFNVFIPASLAETIEKTS